MLVKLNEWIHLQIITSYTVTSHLPIYWGQLGFVYTVNGTRTVYIFCHLNHGHTDARNLVGHCIAKLKAAKKLEQDFKRSVFTSLQWKSGWPKNATEKKLAEWPFAEKDILWKKIVKQMWHFLGQHIYFLLQTIFTMDITRSIPFLLTLCLHQLFSCLSFSLSSY